MTYNGWSNYETWRVYVDIFSDFEDDNTWELVNGDWCKTFVIELLLEKNKAEDLVAHYAGLFLNKVNFDEIAEHLNELIKDNQV